jgi:hypothetical protein
MVVVVVVIMMNYTIAMALRNMGGWKKRRRRRMVGVRQGGHQERPNHLYRRRWCWNRHYSPYMDAIVAAASRAVITKASSPVYIEWFY